MKERILDLFINDFKLDCKVMEEPLGLGCNNDILYVINYTIDGINKEIKICFEFEWSVKSKLKTYFYKKDKTLKRLSLINNNNCCHL